MKKLFFLASKNSKNFNFCFLVNDSKVDSLYIIDEESTPKLRLHKHSFNIDKDDTLLDVIFEKDQILCKNPELKDYYHIKEADLPTGKYYSRIYRPILQKDKLFVIGQTKEERFLDEMMRDQRQYIFNTNEKEIISSINQLAVLSQHLTILFQTVQPDKCNYQVFGHNIRNLLILTCTEVEAQLKGILKASTTISAPRLNTSHYVKLCAILKLKEYSVNLGHYPLDNEIKPFQDWDTEKPTQSLSWYANYNAVKHDRENEFSKATLWSAMEALAGLAILLIAQYGQNHVYWKEQIGGFFTFKSTPTWNYLEHYIPPFEGEEWEETRIDI